IGRAEIEDRGRADALDGGVGESKVKVGQLLDPRVVQALLEVQKLLFFVGDLERQKDESDGEANENNSEQDLFVMLFNEIHVGAIIGRRLRECVGQGRARVRLVYWPESALRCRSSP